MSACSHALVRPIRLLLALLAILAVALAVSRPSFAAHSVTVRFGSGSEWRVFTTDPGTASDGQVGLVGAARHVCLNAFSPSPCPGDAVLYGFPGAAWPADLAPLRDPARDAPWAGWVWAPGVTGSSSPAEFATYFFSKSFVLSGHPTAGTVYLAADDFAELRVNGVTVGSVGSPTDFALAAQAQSALAAFDVGSLLKTGTNTITIKATNGSRDFSSFCAGTPCTYAQNPAGVVFGGSLSSN